jgi:Radical SAM superfamily
MRILLLTPPFTQLNSPYPATAFLKQFLVQKGLCVNQYDLGLELFLRLFSRKGLQQVFDWSHQLTTGADNKNLKIIYSADKYINCVESVISFLKNRESSLAYLICQKDFLPTGHRSQQPIDLEWAFGTAGVIDKACYLSTLFIEDLSDFIRSRLMPDFGFSRYAEKLALSATRFEPIGAKIQESNKFFDHLLSPLIDEILDECKPDLVGVTVPFPGCLVGALKSCLMIKDRDKNIKTVLGGGYVNTELRELTDPEVFNYFDFITLDQGELPLLRIIEHLEGKKGIESLVRTYTCHNSHVEYHPGGDEENYPLEETGFPDYSNLRLKDYLSIMELANPMHRLWNDGKWNKMVIAHGCYWHKCSFCDVGLSYIKDFKMIPAEILVDRIEQVISQTGQTGFHFVDEAAPPGLLKNLALELMRRRVNISWWTNARFEKNFTPDLCRLLAESGCIAIAGGLETVSDRLLEKMNKGVSLSQAARTLHNFSRAGILVHAYLMYGFPTQTEQETINALETVRQLFDNDLIQSCYWHRFSLTAHSPIAQKPDDFQITISGPDKGSFAWNDLFHSDPQGCNHGKFGAGLEKAVYNYMHGFGLDFEAGSWFEFVSSHPTISPDFIRLLIENGSATQSLKGHKRVLWLGNEPRVMMTKTKKNRKPATNAKLVIYGHQDIHLKFDEKHCEWISNLLQSAKPTLKKQVELKEVFEAYENQFGQSFQDLLDNPQWKKLEENGLIYI